MSEQGLFSLLNLIGTLAFAISGAAAAYQKKLDLFGIVTLAYITACGGGIVRDLCIGAVPPAGLSDWRYLALSILASALVIGVNSLMQRLSHPVLLFDAVGLGFFAVFGAQKTLAYGHSIEAAIILGVVSAVGGGIMRDLLLNRTPIIMQKEIYASAALLAAVFQTVAHALGWSVHWSTWVGISLCFVLRFLSLRYHWNLPRFAANND